MRFLVVKQLEGSILGNRPAYHHRNNPSNCQCWQLPGSRRTGSRHLHSANTGFLSRVNSTRLYVDMAMDGVFYKARYATSHVRHSDQSHDIAPLGITLVGVSQGRRTGCRGNSNSLAGHYFCLQNLLQKQKETILIVSFCLNSALLTVAGTSRGRATSLQHSSWYDLQKHAFRPGSYVGP